MIAQLNKRYVLEDYSLEAEKKLFSRGGQPIHLPKKPFEVLLFLVENRDRYVSRAELLDHFWEGKDVYDDALRKCIGAIRKAFDEQSDKARFIETRWGVGYRFIGSVEEQFVSEERTITEIEQTRGLRIVVEEEEIEDKPGADEQTSTSSNGALVRRSTLLRYPVITAVTLVAIAILIVAVVLVSSRRPSTQSANLNLPIHSVAVLPLKNLSSDSDSEYFSDGLTENLINTLSRIEGLKVISRGSVFAFKGKDADPREVREKLGVDALLEGSVMKIGERVRVNVRLVRTGDGQVLWASNIYDRPIGDIFTIQDEIARNAAAGLRLELSGDDQKRLARRYTTSVTAYNQILRGWYFLNQRTPSGMKKAIEAFQQAINADPNCALAYAHLAGSYALGVWYIPLDSAEAMRQARAAATRAVEIDPNLTESHLAMSHVLSYDWDWDGAQREMERARELDPTFNSYGYAYHLLLAANKPDEAVRWIKRSEELDPLSPLISANVGQILYYARRYDEAVEQGRKTVQLDPNYAMGRIYLGQAYIQKKMFSQAIDELQRAIVLSENNPETKAILGYAYAAAGKREEAEKVISELTGSAKRGYVSSYSIAEIYAVLKRNDEAFAWLDKAYNERAAHFVNLRVDPVLDSLRSDPRFDNLLRRVNLTS